MHRRNLQRGLAGECVVVPPRDLFTALPHLVDFPELSETNRGEDIRHVVLETRSQNLVRPGALRRITLPAVLADAMKAHDAKPLGLLFGVCGHHAAFTSRQSFGGIERKARGPGDAASD